VEDDNVCFGNTSSKLGPFHDKSTLEVKEIQNHISAILQERNEDGWKINKIVVTFDISEQL
jgi:hypothetical protein